MQNMNEILVAYTEDLRDSILTLSEALMKVQAGIRDKETVNGIFRVAHTIKGNSAAMGFDKVQKVMHTMEDILSEVRNGTRELTDEMTGALFACQDFLDDCLKTIESESSDEGMNTEKLLERLIVIKNKGSEQQITQVAAEVVPETKPVSHRDADFFANTTADLWEFLAENIKDNKYSAYRLDIRFMKNSSMKAVRAWMIFDRIEKSGILTYSNPPRLSDSGFSSTGETPFNGDIIETIILCEREISDLAEDLRQTPDVESVEVKKILNDDIFKKVEFIKLQKKIIDEIQEIGVELLGIESQSIGEDSIKLIIEKMNVVISSNIAADSSPVNIVSRRIITAFEGVLKSGKRVPISERTNIIFLCHCLEECILSGENVKNDEMISLMYKRFDDLLDVITVPDLRVGDILTSGGLITSADAESIAGKQREENLKFGQIAVKQKLVSALDVVTALNAAKSDIVTPVKSGVPAVQNESGFVRIPVAKVDNLIDTLNELMIYNSQLEQIMSLTETEDSKLSNILSRTEKLVKEIQTLSMSLRMIEVKQIFHRLTRIARDTASDLNKKISVNLEGEDTEIDRSAVEKLFDPLMHMVRNSVSHGIEDIEDDRISVGKKPEGQITIAGYSKRGNVYIEVRDDGRGINTKKVYEIAKEKGLINESREYTKQEIFKFIFLPGFSTQDNVNNISGRGVGMNVVEEVVSKLGGKIEIDSEIGTGSIFRIKLPINLAVVNGTIIEMDGLRYIIPTMCVKKFFMAKDKDWVSFQGETRAIKIDDGSIVSVISKEKVFGIDDDKLKRNGQQDQDRQEKEDKEYEMVLLEIDQKLLVLTVDKIIGRQDVVSKPLAMDYASVPYANSASILGDGIASLILDVDAIFKMSLPS